MAVQSLTQRATRRSYVCGSMERATRAGGSADIWSERPPPRLRAFSPGCCRLLPCPGGEACSPRAEPGRSARSASGAGVHSSYIGWVRSAAAPTPSSPGWGGCVTRWVAAALAQARTSSRPRVFRLPYAPSLSCTPWLHLQLHLPPGLDHPAPLCLLTSHPKHPNLNICARIAFRPRKLGTTADVFNTKLTRYHDCIFRFCRLARKKRRNSRRHSASHTQPVTSRQCMRRVSRGTPNNKTADPAFGSKQPNTQGATRACNSVPMHIRHGLTVASVKR